MIRGLVRRFGFDGGAGELKPSQISGASRCGIIGGNARRCVAQERLLSCSLKVTFFLPLSFYITTMPVQSAFTFLIIGGAFSAAAGLIGAINYAYTGHAKRAIANDHWKHHLQQRDWALKYVLKEKEEF